MTNWLLSIATKKIIKALKNNQAQIIGVFGADILPEQEAIVKVIGGKHLVVKSSSDQWQFLSAVLGLPEVSKGCWGAIDLWLKSGNLTKENCPDFVVVAVDRSAVKWLSIDLLVVPNLINDLDKRSFNEALEIIKTLPAGGQVILNGDDELVVGLKKYLKVNCLDYGFQNNLSLSASQIPSEKLYTGNPDFKNIWGERFKIDFSGNVAPVNAPAVFGERYVYAILAGLAVGLAKSLNFVDINSALQNYFSLPGRMNLLPGIKHTLIIDDSYDADADSVRLALSGLEKITILPDKEKFVVIGDLAVFGAEVEEAHLQAGREVAKIASGLITIGEKARDVARGAREAGMEEHRVFAFANAEEAGKFLQNRIEQGDVVLIIGRREMRLERVVKEIMAEPLRASELLVN